MIKTHNFIPQKKFLYIPKQIKIDLYFQSHNNKNVQPVLRKNIKSINYHHGNFSLFILESRKNIMNKNSQEKVNKKFINSLCTINNNHK